MRNRIQYSIVLILVLLSNIQATNAQDDVDWSKVYADKYFFSYERSMKSVVLYASKDTMIQVWVDGKKDMADYTEGRDRRASPDYFESWDNGVAYLLEIYDAERLGLSSSDNVGDGLEFQYDAEMEANVFGDIELYECSNFVNGEFHWDDWDDLKLSEIFNLNNVAYHLYHLEPDECRECAISILEKVITQVPKLEVLYLNLGDAYLTVDNVNKAKESYKKYIDLMERNNKANRIPIRVGKLLKTNTE